MRDSWGKNPNIHLIAIICSKLQYVDESCIASDTGSNLALGGGYQVFGEDGSSLEL